MDTRAGARRLIIALWFAGCWMANPATAATITVDTLSDELDTGCSLRAAILAANLDASPEGSDCVPGSGADRIVLAITGFLALNEPLPDILDEVDIAGPGPQALIVDGGGFGSVFTVAGAGVSLSGLGLTGGNAPFGGGLRIVEGGAVTVRRVDIYSNTATRGGGGIASSGALDISDSTVRDNSAGREFGGGGIYSSPGAALILMRSSITDNASDGDGGGMSIAASPATATLEGIEVRGNTAAAGGGGIHAVADIVIGDSIIADNSAGGGAAVAVVGGGIQAGGNVIVSAVTVSGNRIVGGSEAGAGGIYAAGDVDATASRIEGNKVDIGADGPTRDIGGGILAAGVRAVDTTIAENATRASFGMGATGSAVHVRADAILVNSTVSDNTADDAPGRIVGAVLLAGATTASALTNSTISGNRSRDAALRLAAPASSLSVLNSTITGNHGNGSGLAGIRSSGIVTLANTIVFSNDIDCRAEAGGMFVSAGYNIDGDGSCALDAGADHPDTDPALGPLADNGGPTFTHALLAGSPAIDRGDDGQCPETDQRGASRDDGDLDGATVCDIGAFEHQAEDLRIGMMSVDAGTVAVGDRFRIELIVGNGGRSPIDGVMLTITLPAQLAFVDATVACTVDGDIVTCPLGTLDAGAESEIEITVDADENGSAAIEAAVAGNVDDGNPDNDLARLTIDIVDDGSDAGAGDDGNGSGDGGGDGGDADADPIVTAGGGGAFTPVLSGLLLAVLLRRRISATAQSH